MPSKPSEKKLEYYVSELDAELRLDKYLSDQEGIESRSKAALLIKNSLVNVNGKIAKSSYKVQTGDLIIVVLPEPHPTELQPLNIDLEILFDDPYCLVVNKPAGLVVHPAAGHAQDTLVNALIAKSKNLAMGFGENRPGIVHRLDKDTSGLLVVAKTNAAQESLAQQFKLRTVRRHYWAFVYGQPKQSRGTIRSLLARHPTQRKKFSSQPNGKIAVTHFEVLASVKRFSLIRCRLETGRTHQIRVHMSEMGHPIIGDNIYGSSRWSQKLGDDIRVRIETLNRIALHAYELGFAHPVSLEEKNYLVGWPRDMHDLIEAMGFSDVSNLHI